MISSVLLRNVIVVLFTLTVEANCAIPDYIHVCHRNDPNVTACITNSVTLLKPYLKVGMPELDVPPLEPLLLDKIELRSGSDATRIAASLFNIKVWGPTSFVILELKPNLDKNIFRFKVQIPRLHIEGNYKTDARILFVNLKGEGPANVNISNYQFECKLKGHKVKRDGEEYLEFEKMKLNILVGESSIRLDNLFNGDPILGRATSDVINENSDLFINEIKPVLQNELSEKFTSIANKITLKFTYKELFP